MLNELFELDASRKAAGITLESWHPDYGMCPKGPTYYLLIGPDGDVVDLEPIRELEKRKANRKWEVSNGTSFPAFNVLPFLHAVTPLAKEAVAAFKDFIKNPTSPVELDAKIETLWSLCNALWLDNKESERISKCLKGHPAALLAITGPPSAECAAFAAVLERAAKLPVSGLLAGIKTVIVRKLAENPGGAKEWIDTLLVSTAPKLEAVKNKKVSLVLEVSDRSQFRYPANHAKVQAWINSRLMASSSTAKKVAIDGATDAFGLPKEGSNGTLPEVSLPKLGPVRLRAMSDESPCQFRYGLADSNSFPIGGQARQSMKDSLEWLSHPSRKGKTWQSVAGACGFTKQNGKRVARPGILLAYPSKLDGDPPEIAGWIAGADEISGDSQDQGKFEDASSRVIDALSTLIRELPTAEIRVIVLAKMDKARTKILVSQHFMASYLVASARSWVDGCQNLPPISLNVGTRNNPYWIRPLKPYPVEIIKTLSRKWIRNGTEFCTVEGLKLVDGLLLLTDDQRVIRHCLQLSVTNATPLFLAAR